MGELQMPEHTEIETLADYVASRSDAAFGRLVAQHIDMVFGCALRRCGDRQLSEEISQNVFAILARKAHKLKAGSGLAGWLHKTTLYETKKALRGESRRNRKMKALAEHTRTQNENNDATGAASSDVLPQVDEAIDELPDADRHLLLMRYFEGKNFREIAQATGKSEAASQKQASRALDKLSRVLKRRGVVATGTAIGTILATESAKAAPAGIAAAVTSGAAAGATTVSTSILISNAIQTMTYAKTKIAIVAAAAAAVPIGVQWNAIGNLKEDVTTYQKREIEYVQQGERLTKLEKQIEAIPQDLLALYSSDATLDNLGSAGSPDVILANLQRLKDKKLTALGGRSGTVSASQGGLTEGDSEGETLEDLASSALANYSDLMKNPSMRALVRQQMEGQLEVSHGNFIRHITDDEVKQAQIKKILLDQRMAFAEEGTDQNRDRELTIADEEFDQQLRDLMGEAGWEKFERFEASAPERQELSSFRDVLEENGATLTFETEQQLMAIMYEERMNHDYLTIASDLLTTTGDSPTEITSADAMRSHFENQRVINTKIRARVSSILDAEQLATFEEHQNSHLEMVEQSVELSHRVLQQVTEDSDE